ncbi:MAG TPA: hypothetical protein PK156_29175 [Polyangium sp.]|nr:hypothetical protein [Polyangium sp.]
MVPAEVWAGLWHVGRLPKCGLLLRAGPYFVFTKETALLHANFAMDSISHSLQAFLMIAGGIIGLLAAFSLVDSSAADSAPSAENRVQSGSHAPAERGAPGRRF